MSYRVRCDGVDRHPSTKKGLKNWVRRMNTPDKVCEIWQKHGSRNAFRLELISPIGTTKMQIARNKLPEANTPLEHL